MEQKQKFQCTGNCLNCLPAQRAYCASQHSYSNMKVLDAIMTELLSMKEAVIMMSGKIEAIQNNEAEIFDPSVEVKSDKPISDTAQEGAGAEE